MSAVRLARAATGRARDREVRRLLPRPRRPAARLPPDPAWPPSASPTRRGSRPARWRIRWWRRTTTSPRWRRCSPPAATRSPPCWSSRWPATWAWCRRRRGFSRGCAPSPGAQGALLVFDEVMTGWRVHPAGAQVLYDITAGPHLPGQGDRRRAAGRRVRRLARELMEQIAPAGPVYQAGTLSGNPLAMAAGLATLEVLSRPGVWERAERWAADARWRSFARPHPPVWPSRSSGSAPC